MEPVGDAAAGGGCWTLDCGDSFQDLSLPVHNDTKASPEKWASLFPGKTYVPKFYWSTAKG